jgi:phosphohistidine swiveling domain-containing protein
VKSLVAYPLSLRSYRSGVNQINPLELLGFYTEKAAYVALPRSGTRLGIQEHETINDYQFVRGIFMSTVNYKAFLAMPLLAVLCVASSQTPAHQTYRGIASLEVSTVVNPHPLFTAEIKTIEKSSILDRETELDKATKDLEEFSTMLSGVKEDFKKSFEKQDELDAFKSYVKTEVKNFLQIQKDIIKHVDGGKLSDEQSLELQTKLSNSQDVLEELLSKSLAEAEEKKVEVAAKVEEKEEKKVEKKAAVVKEEETCTHENPVLTTQIESLIKSQESMMDMFKGFMQMMMVTMQNQQMNQYSQMPQNYNNPYGNSQNGNWTFVPNGFQANILPFQMQQQQQPSNLGQLQMQMPGLNQQSSGAWAMNPQMSFQQDPRFMPNQTFQPGNFNMTPPAPFQGSFNLEQSAPQMPVLSYI